VKSRDTDNIGEQVKNKQKDEQNGLHQTLERSETMCSRRISSSSSENIVGERGKKNLSKTEGIHNNLMYGHFIRVKQILTTVAFS
jgi:hypothetical protein